MKRRKSDQQIDDELYQAATDALDTLVGALWHRDLGMLLSVDEVMTETYEKALAANPKTRADREFLARQALRLAMDHQRTHDDGPES